MYLGFWLLAAIGALLPTRGRLQTFYLQECLVRAFNLWKAVGGLWVLWLMSNHFLPKQHAYINYLFLAKYVGVRFVEW